MRQGPIAEMLRRALRDQYDAVLTEPLPKRWAELINSLDERERQTRGLDPDQALRLRLRLRADPL
jgi:hypothetical protein